jgi:hypothetical protein
MRPGPGSSSYADSRIAELRKPDAVQSLLEGLVDYAGLFPPASQTMDGAVESYASYRDGPDRAALGRFIVPVERLDEFEAAARELMPRGERSEPWPLSVLVAESNADGAERMLRFNCHHWPGSADGHAVIDAVELKVANEQDVERHHRLLPKFFVRYFEIPLSADVDGIVKAIAKVGGRAKVRTGGVTSDAFPAAEDILRFLVACQRENVAFKATAGLHHPVRGAFKLTYKPGSDVGTMYGFLNVFLAAALLRRGEPEAVVLGVLNETDAEAFEFSSGFVGWRGHRVDSSALARIRREFAISFGSCSFREPVDELTALVSEHA